MARTCDGWGERPGGGKVDWYKVEFDDEKVTQKVSPPGQESWTQSFLWADVVRVCFEATDFLESDAIYVFTRTREKSYVIPSEAQGGLEFWNAVIERGLFDAKLAIDAAASGGGLFCWPEITDEDGEVPD